MQQIIGNRTKQLILSVFLLAESLQYAVSLPSTINSDAVQSMSGAPALGRGYSITTNTMLGSCLNITNFNETEHSHSYNFDYYFSDFTSGGMTNGRSLGGKISKSFGFSKVKSAVSKSADTPKHSVVATMRLERFFSSVWESGATLSEDASKMLDDEEFINFFMSCGPSYVRSLQRAQEVTAIISYEAEDDMEARKFANMLRLFVYGNRGGPPKNEDDPSTGFPPLDFDASDIMKTLSIEILGYGLGLNKVGSETLVATSLNEFNDVMKFAFDSMTKNNETETSSQTGVVYNMEVVPWADNAEFLKYADVDFNRILSPVPRDYMPDTIPISDEFGERLGCEDEVHVADNFGKCCEEYEKVNITLDNGFIREGCIAKQYMSPIKMKENLETNAEFVTWLGSIVHEKKTTLMSIGQCVNKLRSFPPRLDYEFLEASEQAKYDYAIDMAYTSKELKAALDPNSDLSIVTMVSGENEEFVEMFYQPCLDALYGRTLSEDQEMEPKYIMAEPWYNHKECALPSCLERNMAWDRVNGGGCVEGILARKSPNEHIPDDNDRYCARALDNSDGGEICKYLPDKDVIAKMDICRQILPQGKNGRGQDIPISMSYLIDYFCAPKSTGEEADEDKMDYVDHVWRSCTERATLAN